MDELSYAYGTGALIVAWVAVGAFRKSFDPFAPLWLFLAGYFQVYVVQAISNHEWAIRARDVDLVSRANLRALWALAWFLLVYHSGIGKAIAARLPRAAGPPVGPRGRGRVADVLRLGTGLLGAGVHGPWSGERLGRGVAALRVPDPHAGGGQPADRDGPPHRATPAGRDLGRRGDRRALRGDLDVPGQAVAPVVRRPVGDLRVLHLQGPAAVEGHAGRDRLRLAPVRDGRDQLAEQPAV